MNAATIISATTMLLWSTAGSLALDVGVGGVGVSAGSDGVSAGVGGASVGVGTGSDGSVGAGVSTGGTSADGEAGVGGASFSAGGAGGSSSGGGSGGSGGSATGSTASSATASGGAGAAAAATDAALSDENNAGATRGSISLPSNLRPDQQRRVDCIDGDCAGVMQGIAGVPPQVVVACRQSILQAAEPYGLVRVSVVSQGQTMQMTDGSYRAPVLTQVVYEREGGYEVRQAPIWCELNEGGAVIGLSDMAPPQAG